MPIKFIVKGGKDKIVKRMDVSLDETDWGVIIKVNDNPVCAFLNNKTTLERYKLSNALEEHFDTNDRGKILVSS